MTLLKEARIEAISELSSALFTAAGEAFLRHGDDPQGDVILAG